LTAASRVGKDGPAAPRSSRDRRVVDGAGVEQLHGALDDRVQGPLGQPVEQPEAPAGLSQGTPAIVTLGRISFVLLTPATPPPHIDRSTQSCATHRHETMTGMAPSAAPWEELDSADASPGASTPAWGGAARAEVAARLHAKSSARPASPARAAAPLRH